MTDVIITESEPIAIIITDNSPNVISVSSSAPQGLSAYQVAVSNGFVGTESQWIDTLQGNIQNVVLTKTPLEIANIAVNFSNRLSQGSVVTSVNSVSTSPSGITIQDIGFTSNSVNFKASSGVLNQGYKIEISIVTSSDGTIVETIHLLII